VHQPSVVPSLVPIRPLNREATDFTKLQQRQPTIAVVWQMRLLRNRAAMGSTCITGSDLKIGRGSDTRSQKTSKSVGYPVDARVFLLPQLLIAAFFFTNFLGAGRQTSLDFRHLSRSLGFAVGQ
jgi:hypothetical protein